MGIVTKVEEILSMPMEIFHRRKGFQPVDLSRMTVRCMEQGCKQGINRVYAPNDFIVLLNPLDYRELSSFIQNIRAEILEELTRIVTDRNYLLAGTLTLKIKADDGVGEGLPTIRGKMTGSDDPDSVVTFQQHADDPQPAQQQTGLTGKKTPDFTSAADPQTTIEEGVILLREGHPEQAVEILTACDQEAEDIPQYHAVLGVCSRMLGREEEAGVHFSRLEEMGHVVPRLPPPDDDRKQMDWREDRKEEKNGKDGKNEKNAQKKNSGYRLEYTAGASLIIRDNELILENRYLDKSVTVDGRVSKTEVIRPGSVLTMGTVHLRVMEEPSTK